MVVSDIEKQRLLNIARNKQLLKSLSLDKITQSIKNEVEEQNNNKKEEKSKKVRRAKTLKNAEPTRKSRRLQGVKAEDTDEYKLAMEVLKGHNGDTDNKLKNDNEYGISLNGKGIDVRRKLPVNANLMENPRAESNGIKTEDDKKLEWKILSELNQIIDQYDSNDSKNYPVKQEGTEKDLNDIKEINDSISNLKIYDKFAANKISLTEDRMSYVRFHPTSKEKVVIGGDILGNLGIWNSNNDDVEGGTPSVTKFQLHSKHIAKVCFQYNNNNNMYTCSYDNSMRVTDLKTLKSTEIISVVDTEYDEDIGISDMQISTGVNQDPKFSNLIFYTTLTGHFGYFDIRAPPRARNNNTWRTLKRMSDKKIGGFSLYPLNNYLISTASLDRKLRIWDIRKSTDTSSWSEKFPEDQGYEQEAVFESRLSVSLSDWNSSGDIVCNGYANQICIFNEVDDALKTLKSKKGTAKKIKPDSVIKHNCKTGKWVSILKARWQTKGRDGYEKFVIANLDHRAFDVYGRNGVLVARLKDPNLMTAIPAVASFHPTENWIVGGTAKGKAIMYS